MIKAQNLKKYFISKRKILKAVDGVSFEIFPGETLGLVGESGCGKTTIGRMLLAFYKPTEGEIFIKNRPLSQFSKSQIKQLRKHLQIIFQDPYSSLNPRMTVEEILSEPLTIHKLYKGKAKCERIAQLLYLVGLDESFVHRFPLELSGGQRQRICIARALAVGPEFIVCDEPIAALDVSIQAQIVNLLKKLQREMGLTYLFISHDLAIVKYLSNRVAVMYLGQIVEIAPSKTLYANPLHPYTQGLLSSIPIPDPEKENKRTKLSLLGEIPSPFDPPKGCVFSTRCPKAREICKQIRPKLKEQATGHFVSCHLY